MKAYTERQNPPKAADCKTLFRNEFFSKREEELRTADYICIEAQAGQGKTTLARQMLQMLDVYYIWFPVNLGARDPIHFVRSLLLTVKKSVPGFYSSHLEKNKTEADSTDDLHSALCEMITLVARIVNKKVMFVFDDLHLLEDEAMKKSLQLLDALLENRPKSVSFMLLSRFPVTLKSQQLKFGQRTVYLTEEDLSLTESESIELYQLLTGQKASLSLIRQIQMTTEGWVMGFVIITNELARNAGLNIKDRFDIQFKLSFFQDFFESFSPERQRILILYSHLDEIPSSLTQLLTDDFDVISFLTNLMHRNVFVRFTDDTVETFAFHHLFAEFLQDQRNKLQQGEIEDFLSRAADYWLEMKAYGKSMMLLAKARNYKKLEQLLPIHGAALVAQSQLINLQQIMAHIPAHKIEQSPWLVYFQAILEKEGGIATAEEHFEQALQLFRKNSDELGEMLTLSQLIYYHILFTGKLTAGEVYINRAAELYDQLANIQTDLLSHDKITAAMSIGTGLFYIAAEFERGRRYILHAVELAENDGYTLLATQVRTSLAYTYLFAGRKSPAAQLIEKSFEASATGSGNSIERMLTKFCVEVNFFHAIGDHENFLHYAQVIENKIGKEYLEKTVIGIFVKQWEVCCALGRGKLNEAREIIETTKCINGGKISLHQQSEFNRIAALIDSLSEDKMDTALEYAELALAQRQQVGGVMFEIFTAFTTGFVFVLGGKIQKGMKLLDTAVALSEDKNLVSTLCSGLIHRAYCLFETGQNQKGLKDLHRGLTLMHRSDQDYFKNWCPQIMRGLLKKAVSHGIEQQFCLRLARMRLDSSFTPNGKMIPLLHIHILGDFKLVLNDVTIIQAIDLTPIQRNLFSILLFTDNLQINQEIVQERLWPEANVDLAKKSFETLISRLRKKLDERLGKNVAKRYLVVKNKILSLEHCEIDAKKFSHLCKTGLQHCKRGAAWQGENCFYPAFKLWKGCFSRELFFDSYSSDYCYNLQKELVTMVSVWSENLLRVEYKPEALAALEKALSIFPFNEQLVKKLYHYHMEEANHNQARQLLRKYTISLQQEDFSEEEVNQMVANISNNL